MYQHPQTRRRIMQRFAGLGLSGAGLALLAGCRSESSTTTRAEPPPETTTIRLVRVSAICAAPEYVAEDLLRAEGFTDVQYIQKDGGAGIDAALASGEADINNQFGATLIVNLEAGHPIVILGGMHVGCLELFGTDEVRSIRDLKGKTVAVNELRSSPHIYVSSMLAYVGLKPQTDVTWVTHPPAVSIPLLAAGKVDALLGIPPVPQQLRAEKIGHVVVNSSIDRPWSQYFCCMLAGNREFVKRNPVATKRAMRAILKATDLCASEPERAAQFLVDRGYTARYDYALQVMQEIPYTKWREYDPEDTVRFYALRLQEAGMIKSTPKKIIAQGTNWRFFNELKKELKT